MGVAASTEGEAVHAQTRGQGRHGHQSVEERRLKQQQQQLQSKKLPGSSASVSTHNANGRRKISTKKANQSSTTLGSTTVGEEATARWESNVAAKASAMNTLSTTMSAAPTDEPQSATAQLDQDLPVELRPVSEKTEHLRRWLDGLERGELRDPQEYAINGYP